MNPRARDLLDALGLALGGTAGALPGLLLLIGHVVTAATGPGGGDWNREVSVLGAGLLVGSAAGLAVAERLAAHAWPSPRALAAALLGLCAGACMAIAVVAVGAGTVAEPIALATAFAMPTAGGLALFRRQRG